jgi:hypothetical protein
MTDILVIIIITNRNFTSVSVSLDITIKNNFLTEHHAMKAYWVSGGTVPLIP